MENIKLNNTNIIDEPLIKVRITDYVFDPSVDKTENGKRLTCSLNGWDYKVSSTAYDRKRMEQCTLHPKEFLEAVSVDGWCFTSWMKNGSKVNNDGFFESNHLPVDIDGTIMLNDFFSNDFAKDYCYGYYTSKSHTEEAHRFRALFRTERDIVSQKEYSYAIQGLFGIFNNTLDDKCKNSGRIWFGSVNAAKWEYFGDDKIIDNETLEMLINLGKEDDESMKKSPAITSAGFSGSLEADHIFTGIDNRTFTAMDVYSDHQKRACYCPYHNDKSPSAFVNYHDKTDSVWLICTSNSCGERRVMNPIAADIFKNAVQSKVGGDTKIINLDSKYLPDISVRDDERLIFVKSPKGTGKTEFLGRISDQVKSDGKSLLNLGHRVFLLSNLSKRFKTDYYLESKNITDNFSLCINSLARLNPKIHKPYDFVIIDESEQFLMNMVSTTLKSNRKEIFSKLIWVLSTAKHVICCDADLTHGISVDLIRMLMQLDESYSDFIVYNNEWKSSNEINLFASRNHLIGSIYSDIEQGKRLYITTNSSKDFIKHIVTIISFIEQEQGIVIPKLVVTADTSDSKEVKNYIKDLADQATKGVHDYQIVIASPTLGTGVSIDGDIFDSVYGIFNNKIYTYQECDQAISRVRNCDNVNVFIQPISSDNPKTEDQLYDEIIQSEELTNNLGVYSVNGRELNPVEIIYAKFYARVTVFYEDCLVQKPQKFVRLRQFNGNKVNFIEKDIKQDAFGKNILKLAKEHTIDVAINLIKNSHNLTSVAAYDLMSSNSPLTTEEIYELKKYRVSEFYNVPVAYVTEEQIRDVEEHDVMEKYSNIRLLYTKVDTLINRDDNERIYSDDIMPHFKHRTRAAHLFDIMAEASGLCIDQLMLNALKYNKILELGEKANDFKKGSREYKAARKKFNSAMVEIKVIVTDDQITEFSRCVDTYKAEINRVFGSNIKKPMDKSASVKVFNTLMDKMGIRLKSSRKGPQGSEGKEYSVDYAYLSSFAEKFEAEKADIILEDVPKPKLPDIKPVEAEVIKPYKIDLRKLMKI